MQRVIDGKTTLDRLTSLKNQLYIVLIISCLCFALFVIPTQSQALVSNCKYNPSWGWQDSYQAQDKSGRTICFCDSTFDHGIGKMTPDGYKGKTVKEICQAIGAKFGKGSGTKTYYNSIQCGHKPYNYYGDEEVTPGIIKRTGNFCNTMTGAKWPSYNELFSTSGSSKSTSSNNSTATGKSATTTSTTRPTNNNGSMIAINAGGGAYTDARGISYIADKYYRGGSVHKTRSSVKLTLSDPLFQTERYGKGGLEYAIPVKNGSHVVDLDFAEIYFDKSGKRVFDVSLEGKKVLDNFDIAGSYGKNTAVTKSFIIDVKDGTLNIKFDASKNFGKVAAIRVYPNSGVQNAVAINVGGGAYTDKQGVSYSHDRYFVNGRAYRVKDTIGGTPDSFLFQTERYGAALEYEIPLKDGDYIAELLFAEIYFNEADKRVFDIYLEDKKMESNVDLFKDHGKHKAVSKKFDVNVIGNSLNVKLVASKNYGKLAAIKVYPKSGMQTAGLLGQSPLSKPVIPPAPTTPLPTKPKPRTDTGTPDTHGNSGSSNSPDADSPDSDQGSAEAPAAPAPAAPAPAAPAPANPENNTTGAKLIAKTNFPADATLRSKDEWRNFWNQYGLGLHNNSGGQFPSKPITSKNGVLTIPFSKGDWGGAGWKNAGAIIYQSAFGDKPNYTGSSLYIEQMVKFSENFDWGAKDEKCRGGKFGVGTTVGQTVTGKKPPVGSFQSTNMWRGGGVADAYVYHPDQSGNWPDRQYHSTLQRGKWLKFGTQITVNDPGKRNGKVEIWINGKRSYARDDFRISNTGKATFRTSIGFFYGGDSDCWRSRTDNYIQIKDIRIYNKKPN